MQYREMLNTIRANMQRGLLTYEQAEKAAKPIIDEMNKKAEKIAKEYGKKHNPFTFRYLMR